MTSHLHRRSTPGGVVHLSTVHQPHDNRILNKEGLALARAGLEPVLVVGTQDEETFRGVHIVPIKRRSRVARLVLSQAEAWQRLRSLQPALLQVHDPELVPMALVWGRLHDCRVVFDAHEDLVGQIETKQIVLRFGLNGLFQHLGGTPPGVFVVACRTECRAT